MPYLPAAASLLAAHKGRIQNIRAATLRETKEERNLGVVILTFEDESRRYDQSEHSGYSGSVTFNSTGGRGGYNVCGSQIVLMSVTR